MSSCRRLRAAEPQRCRTVQHPGCGVVVAVVRTELDRLDVVEERVERDAGLEPCERRAGAHVRAGAEREVLTVRRS